MTVDVTSTPELDRVKAAWSPLDFAVRDWMRRMGASEELAEVAAWVSVANRQSHAAVTDETLAEWIGRRVDPDVYDSEFVVPSKQIRADATSTSRMPLVRDNQGRLFLYRNYMAEQKVARLINARRVVRPGVGVEASVIASLFGPAVGDADELQRRAVAMAADKNIFLLAGGPGTGKTSTVFRMLMAKQLRADDVALAAPTGKAAKRLTEALRDAAGKSEHSNGLETVQAKTVHRFLIEMEQGLIKVPTTVVIDEASMLDIDLLLKVLETLPADCQLILVGDPNQLMSVGTGTVLSDLVAAFDGTDFMVELTHNFRVANSPELVRLNSAALNNQPETFVEIVAGLMDVGGKDAFERTMDLWADEFAQDLGDLKGSEAHLQATSKRQLLCAVRQGRWGVESINRELERRLRRDPIRAAQGEWFEGRRILVTEHHYGLGLFNGDVGVCQVDASTHSREVVFESVPDESGAVSYRRIPVASLPAYEPAWAMTIHKSQGSEYSRIGVVLPPGPSSRILSRQLIYTAVSRAKSDPLVESAAQSVRLWADRETLDAGLTHAATRMGGLRDALLGI